MAAGAQDFIDIRSARSIDTFTFLDAKAEFYGDKVHHDSVSPVRFLQDIKRDEDGNFIPPTGGGVGLGTNTKTDLSRECTKDCIDIGDVFCRDFFTYSEGVCCSPSDTECMSSGYDFCTNQFSSDGMKLFTCPFESQRCGTYPWVQIPTDGVTSIQSRGFDTNDVCYYYVEAMPTVDDGDFIYVEFFALSNVKTSISIKPAIDESMDDVTCDVVSGDIILLRHPDKLYVSFKA